MERAEFADQLVARLNEAEAKLKFEFQTPGRIPSALLDDVLPPEVAQRIYDEFPSTDRMVLKRSMKENKYVSAQLDAFPVLEEITFAFQDPRVIELVSRVTCLKALEVDPDLYAGGISVMTMGGFLRPHLDNSHLAGRDRYRVLNLLYYVTPGWQEGYGGNLQLWDNGPHKTVRTIPSRFNRLVIMATNNSSWHSVDQINTDRRRCCISNYFFSAVCPEAQPYDRATSFRDERASLTDLVMQADNALRTMILRHMPGAYKNPHRYKRGDTPA